VGSTNYFHSHYTAEKGIYTDTTKTKKLKKVSKFPPVVMELLKRFKAEQEEEAKQIGSKWQDCDRLFTQWDGSPMHPQTPYKWLMKFCERAGVPFRNIHSLRHLHASLLIYQGMDVVTVSSDMGHSTAGTTLNLYSHMFQEAKARNCNAITAALDFSKKEESPPEEPEMDDEDSEDETFNQSM